LGGLGEAGTQRHQEMKGILAEEQIHKKRNNNK